MKPGLLLWSLGLPLSLSLCPSSFAATAPLPVDLPEGFAAVIVAAPPLVGHPIMAAVGGPGQLFVGDASGTNLNKAGLEKELPNRVLLLTDTNGDGLYDRSTVFADRMTFPQGGVWLDGSLYVASPPGLWKLTDTDGDGVADRREMIVGGFEYTGNAADVHGPFLHPNGRLYWCHGRKGHEVRQKDGTLVHAGLASGIWSCRSDGSDVRWHALSCADNPTEIDFTPEGEILGTVNIHFTNPRGDTIMHWLRGGVYPREDQLKAIVGLPRTLDPMPFVHNFGHIAVSGCAFHRSGALNPGWRGNLFVVHFNTQRVSRLEVIPDGASYKVAEHEFLKLRNPDAHLTDVLEDRDGSLLVVDTGGWFRIGCPSSLMAKPDIAGGIYRIRKIGAPAKVEPWGIATAKVWEIAHQADAASVRQLGELLANKDTSIARAAGNALASLATPGAESALITALNRKDPGVQLAAAHALGQLPSLNPKTVSALLRRLEGDVDRSVEHQAMFALLNARQPAPLAEALRNKRQPALQRRALVVLDQLPNSPLTAADVLPLLDAKDAALAGVAAGVVARRQEWASASAEHFASWLKSGAVNAGRLALVETVVKPWLAGLPARNLVASLLTSPDLAQQRAAWRILAGSAGGATDPRWLAPLRTALTTAAPADLPLVLEAAAKAATPELQSALREFSAEAKRPLSLRLKALDASLKPDAPLPEAAFDLLCHALADPASVSARLEATRLLRHARLSKEQVAQLIPLLPALGPLELRQLLPRFRTWAQGDTGIALALALKDSIALASFQESEIRSVFGNSAPEAFAVLAPALHELSAGAADRRRKVEALPALVARQGHAAEGRKLFESGKGACTACHRIGNVGNLVGPNLSAIGAIRTERDLLESILFPSSTLARDYEAHAIEMAGGQSLIGVIRKSLPGTLVVADASGQEHTLPRAEITAMQTLPTSLMPDGLDRTLTEGELLDLVAFLRSRK